MTPLLLFSFLLATPVIVTPLWSEFQLHSIEPINGTAGKPLILDSKLTRISRGVFAISATVTVNDDPTKYTTEASVYFSKHSNNVYKLLPIKMMRGPLCDKMNDEYRHYLMEGMRATSDLPQADKGDLCALFEQRNYTINSFQIAQEKYPKFLDAGGYKLVLLVRDGNNVVTSGLTMICSLL